MEPILKGNIKKSEEKKITITWKWEYENGKLQDIEDTEDGSKITNYNFTIYTIGGAYEN